MRAGNSQGCVAVTQSTIPQNQRQTATRKYYSYLISIWGKHWQSDWPGRWAHNRRFRGTIRCSCSGNIKICYGWWNVILDFRNEFSNARTCHWRWYNDLIFQKMLDMKFPMSVYISVSVCLVCHSICFSINSCICIIYIHGCVCNWQRFENLLHTEQSSLSFFTRWGWNIFH